MTEVLESSRVQNRFPFRQGEKCPKRRKKAPTEAGALKNMDLGAKTGHAMAVYSTGESKQAAEVQDLPD